MTDQSGAAGPRNRREVLDEIERLQQRLLRLDDRAGRPGHNCQNQCETHAPGCFYEQLVQSQMDFVTRGKPDGTILFANDALCRFMDLPADQIVGGNIRDFMTAAELSRALGALEKIQSAPHTTRVTNHVQRGDGQMGWIEWSLAGIVDDNGQLVQTQAVGRDVTEAHEATNQLAHQKELLDGIIDHNPYAIILLDAQGNLLRYNQAAAKMFGQGVDLPYNVLANQARHSPKIIQALQTALSGGREHVEAFWMDLRDVHPDKPSRPVCASIDAFAVHSSSGQVERVVFMLEDITPRIRAEQRLQQALQKLAQAREDERRRLAKDLHDSLGQSLIGMQLALRAMAGDLDEVGRKRLESIAATAGQLVGEVRQISHGLFPSALEELGLSAALKQLVASACDAGLAARLEATGNLPAERFDRPIETALFRIAQEAVANTLRHAQADELLIRVGLDDSGLTMEVRDDGKGFDPDSPLGRGMGLASMAERAAAFGGKLQVSSRPGRTSILTRVSLDGC
ncbi:MAG: PAS domain S-box protein [Phycisphaerae bacterium]